MRTERIALVDIDPPAHPSRSVIDEDELEQLAESIRAVGLLNPLIVEERDGRYEIVAGHRRYLAANRAGMLQVDCRIREPGDAGVLAQRVHENLGRTDLSPVEEAAFYAELLEAATGGLEQVAELVRRSVHHIEARLALLTGAPEVLKALEAKQISIGVAEHLNRLKRPEDVRYYLGWAMQQGATVATVRTWVAQANVMAELNAGRDPNMPPPEPPPPPEEKPMPCFLCGEQEPLHDREFWYIHRACRIIWLRNLEQQERALTPKT